jgi:hypothetical protein
MIHICDNCYKIFKTTQHLNQHKNRKNKCKKPVENVENIFNPSFNLSLDIANIEKKTENLEIETKIEGDNISVGQNNPIQNNPNEFNSSDGESQLKLNISENIKNEKDVENLSITNLLEFIHTHKKVLEEKSKLESTLIILKKHIDNLSVENINLKNRLGIVNNFIYNYKSQNHIEPKSQNHREPKSKSDIETKSVSDIETKVEKNDNSNQLFVRKYKKDRIDSNSL